MVFRFLETCKVADGGQRHAFMGRYKVGWW